MSGHRHNPNAATQNQGNSLGDRSCVRQSKLYRMYESGNDVKAILGSSHLTWDTNQKQGAYAGQKVYDHMQDNTYQRRDDYGPPRQEQPQYSNGGGARRTNNENDYPTTKNTLSHYARQDEREGDYYQKGGDSYQAEGYGGNARRQPQQYKNEDYSGGRGASSGGGASSFSIGQSDYSYGRNDGSKGEYRKRRDNEPPAGANDNFPLNKMGTGSSSNSRSSYGGAEESSSYGRGEERTGSGGYRSLKDQINSNPSSFQSQRRKSSEYAAESVARTYFQPQQQQERSTRPW